MAKWPLLKIVAGGAGLVGAALLARGAVQRAGRAKAYLAEGIDEKTWFTLGGLEQWVTIRGQDLDNPVLLVLHGGPGSAMSLLAHKAFPGWDKAFTVVNWDQRGAGRTYGRHGKAGSGEMTIERMVADGLELAEELRRRFPGRPLIVLGISWGSLLGAEMVRRRPELFAAYAGAGQVVDMQRGETLSYFGALDRLKARARLRDAAALEAIGAPPYPTLKGLQLQRKLLISTMPKAERRLFRDLAITLLLAPDSRLSDLTAFMGGTRFSIEKLWDAVMAWRLADGGLTFAVPVVFLQGDTDLQTPTALVAETLPDIAAPHKELVLFTDAAHVALVTHAEAFLAEMVARVRPLAVAKPAAKRKPKARSST
jgi:proline iminopeptidase